MDRKPGEKIKIERVTVLLGANGAGKSRILKEIKTKLAQVLPAKKLIYVEGGRAIDISTTLSRRGGPANRTDSFEQLEENYVNKKDRSLKGRINDALSLLDKKAQLIKDEHSDKMHKWQSEGSKGIAPIREDLPLIKLFSLFNEIFPQIILSLDPRTKNLSCSKNGSPSYSPNELSDGEKQVLSMLADISILAEKDSVIVIDEPELNLNSLLALRLWDSLENELQSSTFIYATHDIGFSMRGNVEKIYTLSDQNDLNEINDITDIETSELRKFLGSIPAILSSNSVLITEGQPDSFDPIFYRWVVGNNSIEIVTMSSSTDVLAVSSRQGVWEKIASTVSIKGVIDRDYKSKETVSNCESDKTIVLQFHEAESYLCLPELVVQVTQAIGLVEKAPSKEEVEKVIEKSFKENMLKIAAQRTFERSSLKISVSIQRHVLDVLKSSDKVEEKLLEEAQSQADYAKKKLDRSQISKCFNEEINKCNKAIEDKDINLMLLLTPGKSLLQKILPLTGAKTPLDLARACSKHIQVEKIPELLQLKEKISK